MTVNREIKRERAAIDGKLQSFTEEFIKFVALQDDKEGELVAAAYNRINAQWKSFCHKKWKHHECKLDAFEEDVKANVKSLAAANTKENVVR